MAASNSVGNDTQERDTQRETENMDGNRFAIRVIYSAHQCPLFFAQVWINLYDCESEITIIIIQTCATAKLRLNTFSYQVLQRLQAEHQSAFAPKTFPFFLSFFLLACVLRNPTNSPTFQLMRRGMHFSLSAFYCFHCQIGWTQVNLVCLSIKVVTQCNWM